jgi:RimJ/RimL family protein N-acetyltransferase
MRRQIVQRYRSEPVIGRTVDLEPYRPEHAAAVIALRNAPRAKYYLNQSADLTLEAQAHWYDTVYAKRDDDIQWVIRDKRGEIVGVNALYAIDLERGMSAEKGRQVVRAEVAQRGPYALEADYLACQLAFAELKLARVVACFRVENTKVRSMNERMGFTYAETKPCKGLDLDYFECTKASFRRDFLHGLLDHWARREEEHVL